MKRILLILSLGLVLLLAFVGFAPSVDAVQYESPGTVVLYVGYPRYEKVYSFEIGEGYTWQNLASDHSQLATEDCRVITSGDTVQLYLPDQGKTVLVYDLSGVAQKPDDVITDSSYVAFMSVSFSIQPVANGVATGDPFILKFFCNVKTFKDFVTSGITLDGGNLGLCKFFMTSDGALVLRTGVSTVNASYMYQYALSYSVAGNIVSADNAFQSLTYYAQDVCVAFGHTLQLVSYTKEPTCTKGGEGQFSCKYCGYSAFQKIDALGHDYNDAGVCKRCDHVNVLKAAGNWLSNAGSAIADFADDALKNFNNLFADEKDAIGKKASSFVTIIAVVAGLSIGIPIALFIGRFIKWLKNLKK